jgi:manganese oxidase
MHAGSRGNPVEHPRALAHPVIHGHRWVDASGQITDNVQLGPGMYTTFEFQEDNPGTWLVHCHVPDHMEGGMRAEYVVSP